MATDKQLAANRRNAQKSTGPRTPEGKAIACLNAVRNGLTGQIMIIPRAEYPTWVAFSQTLTADLNPIGPQELHVAARIVRDTWRLHRIAANEENMYALGLLDQAAPDDHSDIILTQAGAGSDPALAVAISNTRTFFNSPRDFERASLYEQRIKRGLMKDYTLLRQLQHDRNLPAAKSVPRSRAIQRNPPAPIEPEPGYTMFERHYPHTKETTCSSNGFVFAFNRQHPDLKPQIVNSANPYVNRWPGANPKQYDPVVQDPYWPY